MLTVPEVFAAATRAREGAAGAEWIQALPALVDDVLSRWDLEVEAAALHGYVALVVPVRRRDGQRAMLKVSWVDEETRGEASALTHWAGAAAVTLLATAPEDGATLLERLDPHRSLEQVDENQAVALAASLLRRLHIPPPGGLIHVTGIAPPVADSTAPGVGSPRLSRATGLGRACRRHLRRSVLRTRCGPLAARGLPLQQRAGTPRRAQD